MFATLMNFNNRPWLWKVCPRDMLCLSSWVHDWITITIMSFLNGNEHLISYRLKIRIMHLQFS